MTVDGLEPIAHSSAGPSAGHDAKRRLLETLSIVLQGPLLKSNAEMVANTCRQWRAIFPVNPIILAVSESDVVREGNLDHVGPQRRRRTERSSGPLSRIYEACDSIVIARRAQSLPPIKKGLGRSHVNLQIAAAQAGLACVRSEHVLRVRHDITFRDDAFIDHYLERLRLPRGEEALLEQRVLISPYFTLNPFTLERLPFHFSDWFHLGLTSDVRALWDIPPMEKRDARYYRWHPMQPGSGSRECRFLSRWAAEQHIIIHALAGLGRNVSLNYHNDASDAVASLRILTANFVLADFAATPIQFGKYAHLATAPEIDILCITDRDVVALAGQAGEAKPAVLLANKIAVARRLLAAERAVRQRRSPLRQLIRWLV